MPCAGYSVAVPGFRRELVDPDVSRLKYKFTRGLATLLWLEHYARSPFPTVRVSFSCSPDCSLMMHMQPAAGRDDAARARAARGEPRLNTPAGERVRAADRALLAA